MVILELKLRALLDHIVLRQDYPKHIATIRLWCHYNWKEATPEQVQYLFDNFHKYIEIA